MSCRRQAPEGGSRCQGGNEVKFRTKGGQDTTRTAKILGQEAIRQGGSVGECGRVEQSFNECVAGVIMYPGMIGRGIQVISR